MPPLTTRLQQIFMDWCVLLTMLLCFTVGWIRSRWSLWSSWYSRCSCKCCSFISISCIWIWDAGILESYANIFCCSGHLCRVFCFCLNSLFIFQGDRGENGPPGPAGFAGPPVGLKQTTLQPPFFLNLQIYKEHKIQGQQGLSVNKYNPDC